MIPSAEPDRQPGQRWRRIAEAAAGLLSAGLLVLAGVLLIAKALAPQLLGGQGIERATGPQWWRIATLLLVAAVTESAHLLRHRFPPRGRIALAAGCAVCVLAALWLTWWQ